MLEVTHPLPLCSPGESTDKNPSCKTQPVYLIRQQSVPHCKLSPPPSPLAVGLCLHLLLLCQNSRAVEGGVYNMFLLAEGAVQRRSSYNLTISTSK